MRFPIPLSIAALAGLITFALAGAAFARETVRPARPVAIPALRQVVEHYRTLTWTFERAARVHRTPTTFTYRHSADRRYLQWTIDTWSRRASTARDVALRRVHTPPRGRDPEAPAPAQRALAARRLHAAPDARAAADLSRHGHAALCERSRQDRRGDARALAAAPRRGHAPGAPARPPAAAARRSARRSSASTTTRARGTRTPATATTAGSRWTGASRASTAPTTSAKWGTADNWPAWAQLQAAVRAYRAGRGFYPWPNTARACGLI